MLKLLRGNLLELGYERPMFACADYMKWELGWLVSVDIIVFDTLGITVVNTIVEKQ